MTKNNFRALAVVCGFSAITMAACSKDKKNDVTPVPVSKTPQERLLGKWKLNFEGADLNNNGVWDADEKAAVTEAAFVTFRNNSTYLSVYGPDTMDAPYVLIDSTKLVFTYPGEKSDTATIEMLTDQSLILRGNDGPNILYFQELSKVD